MQNSLLPCDDVLGSVDDFIAGLVGLVSAIIMAAFRQKYINIIYDIHFCFVCLTICKHIFYVFFLELFGICGINGFNIKKTENRSSENIK